MSKFNKLVDQYYTSLIIEAPEQAPSGIPQDGGPTAPAPEAPAPAPAPEPEVKPLTPEGKIFDTQLALRALAVDPNTIPAADKAIFSEPVTQDNVDSINDWLNRIVGD